MDQLLAQHMVVVDGQGRPRDPLKNHRRMEPQRYHSHINEIVAGIKQSGHKRILIHVHGGLNTFQAGLNRAASLHPRLTAAGYYPIFLNWQSGLKSSYLEHVFRIRQGRVHPLWGPLTFLFPLFSDLGRGLAEAPIDWYHQSITDLRTIIQTPDQKNALALYKRLRARYEQDAQTMGSPPTAIAISEGPDARSATTKLATFLRYWMTLPTKMLSVPVIEAAGQSAWGNMLRRTQTLFRTPSEFDIGDVVVTGRGVENALNSPATGGVSQLMRSLSGLATEDSYQVTLIGHSMGSIVLNEVVRSYPNLPWRNIVYMGAACSIRDWAQSVLPYLKDHRDAQFYNVCLHPMAEAREVNFWDIIIRGSLLEWIDNAFSAPQTPLDRTLGRWENIVQATHIIPSSVRGQVHLKAFGVGGHRALPGDDPQEHGDFGKREFWLPAFWEPTRS